MIAIKLWWRCLQHGLDGLTGALLILLAVDDVDGGLLVVVVR